MQTPQVFHDFKGILTPMAHLDELISKGWGDTPQDKIPENWRTIPASKIKRQSPGPRSKPTKKKRSASQNCGWDDWQKRAVRRAAR